MSELTAESLNEKLQAPTAALLQLPSVRLGPLEIARLRTGMPIARREGDVVRSPSTTEDDVVAAFSEQGELVSVLARRAPDQWTPVKNFLT